MFDLSVEILTHYGLSLTLLLALGLDHVLGEPKKFHHLVAFGHLSHFFERKFNPELNNVNPEKFSIVSAMFGGVCWGLLVLPLPLLYFFSLESLPGLGSWQWLLDGVILYLAIGLRSLDEHGMQVFKPLNNGDIETARHFTGYLVSRDTQDLTPEQMSRATVESMLENGHDAVIASLVYYVIGGAPLVIAHRLANTLDAMWGYKTARFFSFGYVAARMDDLLGFIPGKICTLLYALQRPFFLSLKNAYRQGNGYKSHNGGWVMAAGATVMNKKLGGNAQYFGKNLVSATLGGQNTVTVSDIPISVTIVRRACAWFVGAIFIFQTLVLM